MAVRIDEDACIGCGVCEGLYPDLFRMEDDGKAHVTGLTDYDSTLAHEAAEQCPTEAIIEE